MYRVSPGLGVWVDQMIRRGSLSEITTGNHITHVPRDRVANVGLALYFLWLAAVCFELKMPGMLILRGGDVVQDLAACSCCRDAAVSCGATCGEQCFREVQTSGAIKFILLLAFNVFLWSSPSSQNLRRPITWYCRGLFGYSSGVRKVLQEKLTIDDAFIRVGCTHIDLGGADFWGRALQRSPSGYVRPTTNSCIHQPGNPSKTLMFYLSDRFC